MINAGKNQHYFVGYTSNLLFCGPQADCGELRTEQDHACFSYSVGILIKA